MNIVVKRRISEEENLQGEVQSEIKYGLINVEVYALAGAKKITIALP